MEILLKFEGFAIWKWEAEFQPALRTHKPTADDAAVVDVESLEAEAVIGRIDF